jgi:ATP-dependent helicase YprA (DUF1998 family)
MVTSSSTGAPTVTFAAFEDLLADLVADGRVLHVERLPARPERTAETQRPLPPELAARLPGPLWSHQAEAIDLVRQGRSVVVATGTASGKSLCYQVPIAEAVADRLRPGTALVLGPTKALAQDQLRALIDADHPGVVAATYDGDCTTEERTWVRGNANVVFTNPEMLHAGLLPNHWTSCTSCAASSAPTSPTCCAACVGCASSTARRRRSSSRPPRSDSPIGWRRTCAGCRSPR